jgi:hypothetical protein
MAERGLEQGPVDPYKLIALSAWGDGTLAVVLFCKHLIITRDGIKEFPFG